VISMQNIFLHCMWHALHSKCMYYYDDMICETFCHRTTRSTIAITCNRCNYNIWTKTYDAQLLRLTNADCNELLILDDTTSVVNRTWDIMTRIYKYLRIGTNNTGYYSWVHLHLKSDEQLSSIPCWYGVPQHFAKFFGVEQNLMGRRSLSMSSSINCDRASCL